MQVIVIEPKFDDKNIVLQNGEWVPIPMNEYYNTLPQPPLPYDNKYLLNDTTIIVLVASFRETRCSETLYNMFKRAEYPSRVYFGVVQQNNDEDEDCQYGYCMKLYKENNPNISDKELNNMEWDDSNCKYYSNINMKRLHSSQAKGPVYARALQAELVEYQDYCMQIDAHTNGIQSWDVLMLQQWGMAKNEFAVLSTYPTNIKDLGKNSNKHWEMPHLCEASIVGNGQVRNAQARAAANLQRPILAPLWAAGLSFSRCHAELRVPNDINLKHVFNGEEYGRGSRLWTYGYDFYSVSRPYIGTYYGGQKGGKGWWSGNGTELKMSNDRLATLLLFPESDQSQKAYDNLGFYKLGTQRSYDKYMEWTGLNTKTKKVNMKRNCILKWVPWDDSKIKDEIIKYNNHELFGINEERMKHKYSNNDIIKMGIIQDDFKKHQKIIIKHNIQPWLDGGLPVKIISKEIGNNVNSFGFLIIIILICIIIIGYGYTKNKHDIRKWVNKQDKLDKV